MASSSLITFSSLGIVLAILEACSASGYLPVWPLNPYHLKTPIYMAHNPPCIHCQDTAEHNVASYVTRRTPTLCEKEQQLLQSQAQAKLQLDGNSIVAGVSENHLISSDSDTSKYHVMGSIQQNVNQNLHQEIHDTSKYHVMGSILKNVNQNLHQEIQTSHHFNSHHPHGDTSEQQFSAVHQEHAQQSDDIKEHSDHHHKKDHDAYYNFEYSVNDKKTGDIKRQKEERKGDVVRGEYSLVEEDGNVRTVTYYADWKTGFHARVHNSKPRPSR